MQLSKEEYARKRIHKLNGYSVQMENFVTRVTVRHHSASLVMRNSYPRDGIFNQNITTIKDSYIHVPEEGYYATLSKADRLIKTDFKQLLSTIYLIIRMKILRSHNGRLLPTKNWNVSIHRGETERKASSHFFLRTAVRSLLESY